MFKLQCDKQSVTVLGLCIAYDARGESIALFVCIFRVVGAWVRLKKPSKIGDTVVEQDGHVHMKRALHMIAT